jgi:hypothetical protein
MTEIGRRAAPTAFGQQGGHTMKWTTAYWFALTAAAAGAFGQDVSVTVYNQNRAVVRDVRRMDIRPGVSTVSFRDVAARIDPTTVHFRPVPDTDKLQVLEQNFEYDLASSQTILDKYVDQDIRILMDKGQLYKGRLLNAGGDIVIEDAATGEVKVIRRESVQNFEFPKLPDGLITRPTLVWMLDNRGAESQTVEVSYMTDGVNWHAEYVAVCSPDDKALDLSGWVSIENQSGAAFPDAKLKLVAGDVNVISPKRLLRAGMAEDSQALAMAPPPQFEEESFFEYHLYTLTRPSTLRNNQTQQIALFPPATARAEKAFIYDGTRDATKIGVRLECRNSKADGLGLPLPKGKVRVYKKSSDGSLEFIGEDAIDHTPADEKIRLSLGNAFDLSGERAQKDSKKTGSRSRQDVIEVKLRNHKKDAVQITVIEHFWGDWKIDPSTHPFVKKDATTAEFKVPVAPDGESVLTFTANVKW